MFNRGITQLLEELPRFEGLDGASVKRLLTSAYLEGLDLATLTGEDRRAQLAAELRKLVTSLEVHAILVPGVEEQSRRACAFVAAESLNLLSELWDSNAEEVGTDEPRFTAFGLRERYRRIEAGMLYMIAAFDANAVIAVRDIGRLPATEGSEDDSEALACEWARRQIIALVRLSTPPREEFSAEPGDDAPEQLVSEIRTALWHRIGEICRAHLRWLRLEDEAADSGAVDALDALGGVLEDRTGTAYADLAHLVRLLRFVCDGTSQRALRGVPSPPDDPSVFVAYQQRRCRDKPLLWPSAERYRQLCLPGPTSHAAVSMPTGSGKSSVAELAVAQALGRGWVVYLAPTRALVRQVRRDLRRALGGDIEVREFLGGAEFTALAGDSLEPDPGRAVLVMTPEKCSLALRQSPEAFASLALCVFDECHLIGESGNRGVLAELVLAQILHLAPAVKVVMQSALLQNPEEVAAWLRQATGHACEPIREPWRPTRTLRAVAGFDGPGLEQAQEAASHELAQQPRRVHLPFNAPLNLLVNLQGAWAQDDEADYALAHTTLAAPLKVSRTDDGVTVSVEGYVNYATGAAAQGLVEAGHRVLAFIPANKHYSFSVAKKMRGFGDRADPNNDDWQTLEYLLDLADFELGTRSVLRELLGKGVAVHTSAMLPEERRASELAYDRGIASVVFATGTLAQGLNLPATAVVIGGINIGYDPNLTTAQRQARQQVQLLNAVGRAGRPYIAARSLAIVLPNEPWKLGPEDPAPVVRSQAAPFLAQEDASFALRSQLGPLVSEALQGELTVEGMGVEGLTAFAFLPLRSDVEEAIGILGRSYAAAGRPDVADEQVRTVAGAMVRLGEQVLREAEAPDWLVEAAYDSGLSLRQIVAMWIQVRLLEHDGFPDTIVGWAKLLVDVLQQMPYPIVAEMLPLGDLNGSRMRALADEAASVRHPAAWAVFSEVVQGWLRGVPLTDLAAVGVRDNAAGNSGRGSGNPLPKIIGLTEQIMVFAMTRIAGGLAVLVSSAVAREPDLEWELSPPAARALEQISLAMRAGCGDAASLAWWRFGGLGHRRRLAHTAARLMPPREDVLVADESAREWIQAARSFLEPQAFEEDDTVTVTDDERKALMASAVLGDT
jgi:DEAD/DEAH box helicase